MSLVEKLKVGRNFTQADKAIASYILHHPEDIAHLTIGELASETHTSKSAIVRLCRKIGVPGYRDLRIELATELERRRRALSGIDADRPFGEHESCATMMRSVATLQHEAIEACYQTISPQAVDALALAIAEAPHLLIYAIGETCMATEQFASMLTKLGIHCVVAGLRGDYASTSNLCVEGDLALFVSYSGRLMEQPFCKDVRSILEERGCFTAGITAAMADSAALEGFDHLITFPLREQTEGAIGPFYSSECIRYALNCVYARVFALDYQTNNRSKSVVDQLSH